MASIELSLTADFDKVRRQFTKLERTLLPRAGARAVNEVAKRVKTKGSRQIADQTGITVSNVKSAIEIDKAKTSGRIGISEVVAIVRPQRRGSKNRETNLIAFVSKGKRKVGAFRKKPGVMTSKAWARKQLYRGAFIGRGANSGKLLVFKRTGSSRGAKLKALAGPSIPMTFKTDEAIDVMSDVVKEQFPTVLKSKLQFELSKI